MKIRNALLIASLLGSQAIGYAQSRSCYPAKSCQQMIELQSGYKRHGKLFKISMAVLGAVSIADVTSSYGRYERNSLLRDSNGRFGNKGIAIKGGVTATALIVESILVRKNKSAALPAAYTNFIMSAALGSVVVYNYRINK